jgi:serine/threonine protein phosphatase PrpC
VTGAFSFRTGCITNVGLARELNEDNVLVWSDVGLWAVADGMGDNGGCDIASAVVISALKTLPPSATAAELLAEFEARMVRVNADLRAVARGRAILGTTLVALMVHGI